MIGRYLEEIEVGASITTAAEELTPEAVHDFAATFDPQPMHLDAERATESIFGRLVASGWHTLSLTMRLMVRSRPFGETPIIGVAVDEIRFRAPVDPGTTIRARAVVTGVRHRSSAGGGFVTLAVTTEDDTSGAVVLSQKWTLLVPSRPGEEVEV
jgi:acyl dehydratase